MGRARATLYTQLPLSLELPLRTFVLYTSIRSVFVTGVRSRAVPSVRGLSIRLALLMCVYNLMKLEQGVMFETRLSVFSSLSVCSSIRVALLMCMLRFVS